ncbi:DVU0298 family protein [Desulfonatronum thioautotrophicum]|uniref:DVU0298 family protein n=1 Tax=Desulfonatronum thioautotrophicum TaxID=617001 RepID=UPI0005EB40DC|nr:DVU0298 family protein [Desulfonatronum thioautotrophicum]
MATFRSMKQEFSIFLPQDDWQTQLEAYYTLPLRKVLGPLFSLLLAPEPLVKWRAVSAFGLTVARLAEQDMESARVIMRRLMWNLNEESGAIGWGAPESMGDSLARCSRLAVEFHRILISYAQEPERGDGNYLDHEPLRRGVYWGMARLAEVRPDLVQQGLPTFLELLADADPVVRALGVWGLGSVGSTEEDLNALRSMLADQSPVMLYRNDQLLDSTITTLAREALVRFKP